jgi:HlyD family secretion protein
MLTVIDLHQVHLTVYVPEGQLGRVALGQSALVTVDAYPGRVFTGRVTRISDQAEFTPKNVATQDERVKMVFGVEISLDNNDGSLKPGMPGEATLQ